MAFSVWQEISLDREMVEQVAVRCYFIVANCGAILWVYFRSVKFPRCSSDEDESNCKYWAMETGLVKGNSHCCDKVPDENSSAMHFKEQGMWFVLITLVWIYFRIHNVLGLKLKWILQNKSCWIQKCSSFFWQLPGFGFSQILFLFSLLLKQHNEKRLK